MSNWARPALRGGPSHPLAEIPRPSSDPAAVKPEGVMMNVTPLNGWGKIAGTVTGLDSSGNTTPLHGVVFATGEKGFSFTLKTDANGKYAFWVPVSSSPFSLIASASGWVAQIMSVSIMGGKTTTVNFTLRPQSC